MGVGPDEEGWAGQFAAILTLIFALPKRQGNLRNIIIVVKNTHS
jgi:hypothetical protein